MDEICFSFNNRGVYRNEWEIKFGYKKKIWFVYVYILFLIYLKYMFYIIKMFNLCVYSRMFFLWKLFIYVILIIGFFMIDIYIIL